MMYAYGRGVPQNDDEAAAWFRRAAEQSDAFAQHNLGVFYDSGKVLPLDHAEAARWFRKAADQGLADAQYDLGRLYVEGRGVPQDHVLAHMWLSLSAEQGYEKAVGRRNLVTKDMTPAQITQPEKLARDWKANKHLPE
jgi:TPR repeat protein